MEWWRTGHRWGRTGASDLAKRTCRASQITKWQRRSHNGAERALLGPNGTTFSATSKATHTGMGRSARDGGSMIRPTRAWQSAAVLAAAALALSACGSNNNAQTQTKPKATNSATQSASSGGGTTKGDGTLTIGTLLPQTGDLAFLGPPEFAGVQTAVDDINAAGGVLGKQVVQSKADSGDGTPDIAGQSVNGLLANHADVIIGAAASGVSLSVINQITDAGVVEFSPANTSPAFDDPKTDPHNLYFRTAPSDVLQGAVMANMVLQDGHTNVAILARQDSYGELLAAQVAKGI